MFSIFFIFRVNILYRMKIDGIDKIIIKRLVEDARTPVLSIAREVGISGAAIHQRLKKLEKSKLIKGYKMMINPVSLGYNTIAFVGLHLDASTQFKEIIKRLKEIPEVVESHFTTGNFTVFIKILCKNNDSLMQLLNTKIQTIKGVNSIETFMSLEQQINRQITI